MSKNSTVLHSVDSVVVELESQEKSIMQRTFQFVGKTKSKRSPLALDCKQDALRHEEGIRRLIVDRYQ